MTFYIIISQRAHISFVAMKKDTLSHLTLSYSKMKN